MDQTQRVFPLLEPLQKEIKKAARDKGKREKAQQAYSAYLTQCILSAMEEGYILLIDDIVKILDLEEAYIRRKVLEELDYIILPSGAAEVFNCTNMPNLDFMALRLRRWKKVFIKQASFEAFMEKHIKLLAPYQMIRFDVEKGRYVPTLNERGKEEILYQELPYHLQYQYRFIRKSNYISYVSKKKTESFYRKTKGDIIEAYEAQLIDKERLEKEMALLQKAIADQTYTIEAYQNEVDKYASLEGRVKFKLCLSALETQKKNDIILYSQTGEEIWKLKDVF